MPKKSLKSKKSTTDAVEIFIQMLGDTPELRERIAEEKLNCEIAQLIYDARNKAGLTQKQLAQLIGTKQQVIARLEDADYEGHSLDDAGGAPAAEAGVEYSNGFNGSDTRVRREACAIGLRDCWDSVGNC
jgi:hypothetical protein